MLLKYDYPATYDILSQFYSLDGNHSKFLPYRVIYLFCNLSKKELQNMTNDEILNCFYQLKSNIFNSNTENNSYSRSTYRRYYYSIHKFFKFMYGNERTEEIFSLLAEDLSLYFKECILRVPIHQELYQILEFFHNTKHPFINIMLLLIIYQGIDYTDLLVLSEKQVEICNSKITLTIEKRTGNRTVYITDQLYTQMKTYLKENESTIKKYGLIFFNRQKRPLTPRYMRLILKDAMEELVAQKKISKVYTYTNLKDYFYYLHLDDNFQLLKLKTGLSSNHLASKRKRLRMFDI